MLHEAFKSGVWHFSDIVKTILSGDPVQINVKNGALTTQRIRQPIFWGTNYPPQFKEATRAIINRMIVIVTAVEFDSKAPVSVAKENGHLRPGRYFRFWHETVMAARSLHVCCLGRSGRHLLAKSISHFDPERTLFDVLS